MAKLVVLTEGLTGRNVELSTTKTTIGRLDDNGFAIPEPSVSSHHCEVWLKGDDVVVRDLNSTNGTYLNEVQLAVDKELTLKPGQILRLGQVELRYETGKKQTEQPRQTVRLGEGNTMVVTKEAGFGKKSDNVNKIFIAVSIVLGVVVLAALALVVMNLSGGNAAQ
jgi:pSer/pThr/pTyr-binding forkhead associated (FHA) protein